MKKKTTIPYEIIRFVTVGVIATVIDFAVHSLVAYFLPIAWPSSLITAIATTAGFAVSVIVNYFLSVLWVFQDVDQNVNVSSHKNKFLFVFLSAIGLAIGLALMVGFEALSMHLFGIDLNKWPDDFQINHLRSVTFWAFIGFFGLKTLIVLTYNYFSRKIIIFKKAKEIKDEKN